MTWVRLGGSRYQANIHTVHISPCPGTATHMPQTTRHSPILCQAQGTQPVWGGRKRNGASLGECLVLDNETLDFSKHNHGLSLLWEQEGLYAPRGQSSGSRPLPPPQSPQTRPKGRGALGIQKPALPESALPKTCRLGLGSMGTTC